MSLIHSFCRGSSCDLTLFLSTVLSRSTPRAPSAGLPGCIMSVRECQGAGGPTREARGSAAIDGSHGACGRVWLWSEGRGGRVLPRNRDPRAATGVCQLAGGMLSACAAERRCGDGSGPRARPAAHKFAQTSTSLGAFLRFYRVNGGAGSLVTAILGRRRGHAGWMARTGCVCDRAATR